MDGGKAERFRHLIEQETLAILQRQMEAGTSSERIQELAQQVIDLIKPGMSLQELYIATTKLDDSSSEFAPVVFKVMKEYETTYEQKAITSVSQMVQDGQYDQAQDIVKKILAFKTV